MEPRYFVFDIESVADGRLVADILYPEEDLSPVDAINRYRAELMERYNNDFISYTFQVPVSVVIGKVTADFRLREMVVLDEPQYRPHVITNKFWRGWETYDRPTLVSFNGRTFDVPLMELAAFRYGVSCPAWFDLHGKSFEQPRNRYNIDAHMDLHDQLTNFGAVRFKGGLNLAATMLGKPGKMEVQGHMVQDLYNEGRLAEINDYCRCDVLDTYFVFLRCAVLFGKLRLDDERAIIAETREWLEQQADQSPAYQQYLEHWGDWTNPWEKEEEEGS